MLMDCNCLQELNSVDHAPYIMSALLNTTQSMIHQVYNYYLWTLSLAGTVACSDLWLQDRYLFFSDS
jgi:hypothetical protein